MMKSSISTMLQAGSIRLSSQMGSDIPPNNGTFLISVQEYIYFKQDEMINKLTFL